MFISNLYSCHLQRRILVLSWLCCLQALNCMRKIGKNKEKYKNRLCKDIKLLRILNLFFLSTLRDKSLTHSINDSIELLDYHVLNNVTSFHYLCMVKFFHRGINTKRVRHIETKQLVSVNIFCYCYCKNGGNPGKIEFLSPHET